MFYKGKVAFYSLYIYSSGKINIKEVPPRQILKRDFSHAMSKIRFYRKDALWRENQTYNMSD